MKRILLFTVISMSLLTSCQKGKGVNPGVDEVFPNPSNTNTTSNTSSQTTNSTLPQSASSFITSNYRGYAFKEMEQTTEHGVLVYKVTIVSGGAKIRLLFDANWQFIGEKS